MARTLLHFAVEVTAAMLFIFIVARAFGCQPVRPAFGSPLDCEGIQNHDRRMYCLAVSKGDKTYCESIKDHDLRMQCRAMVKP